MIQMTLSKVTGNFPGDLTVTNMLQAPQPLVQPGTFLWDNREEIINNAKNAFMRAHVGFPGAVQDLLVNGNHQEIHLPPAKGASSGQFLDIYGELDSLQPGRIMAGSAETSISQPTWDQYVWITFWLELTGQDCGPSTDLLEGGTQNYYYPIPRNAFEIFAPMNEEGKRWDRLHEFLVQFERNSDSYFPRRIDSQIMEQFRDSLNGPEGGEGVINQLIDFATEVIKLFNAKWKRLAVRLPDFWYSAFNEERGKISPEDLRPFYEMFLMFSRTAPRDVMVQVVAHNGSEVPVVADSAWTVNGTTRYRFVQPNVNDLENADDGVNEHVRNEMETTGSVGRLSEVVERDLVLSEVWNIRHVENLVNPGAELLAFFKKPKIQKVHLFGPGERQTRFLRMRFSKHDELIDENRFGHRDDSNDEPEPHWVLPKYQGFPAQVIIRQPNWSNDANANTELILKALSAAYPTYTQVVNVTNNGRQPNFAPQGFIYRQVLFLFKVNGKEPDKNYVSNTPIKILPDIWLDNSTNKSFERSVNSYIEARKANREAHFQIGRNPNNQELNEQEFTDLIQYLVRELDNRHIVWI